MLNIRKKVSWFRALPPHFAGGIIAAVSTIIWILSDRFYLSAAALAAIMLSLPYFYQEVGAFLRRIFGVFPFTFNDALIQLWPYLAVTAATLIALGPISLGQMPISQDHANHYFATHVLVHELIPSGRFFGWSEQFGTGYPYGDTYHTATYIVTGLLHLITFGLVPLRISYAFGIVLAWLIPVLAVTAWSRRVAGPVGATLAGIAFALDMGSDREGGWVYAMFHGVWTQHYGVGVWLFALLSLWRVTEKPDTRRISVAVLVTGLAMWIHPMNAIMLSVSGLFMYIVHFVAPHGREPITEKRRSILLIVVLILSAFIGLVWVIRMMLAGKMVFASVAYWQPLEQLMGQLLTGSFFDNLLAVVSVLGLLGLIQIVVKGGRFRLYTVVLMAIFLFFGSMSLLLESDLGLAGGTLGIMQYRRFSVAAKPLFYVMAAVGVSSFGYALLLAIKEKAKLNLATKILIALIIAPLLIASFRVAPQLLRSPVAMPITLNNSGDTANLIQIRDVLQQEAKKCPQKQCRAVYWEKPGHGGLYPVISMADAGFAWLPTLSLPANNFKWINNTTNFDVMAKLGVSVVISKWPQENKRLEAIGTYGRHHVYRLKGARAVHAEIDGPGEVKIKQWGAEKRVIQLKGVSDISRLTLYHPPYEKWHATQQGKKLPITMIKKNGQRLSSIRGIQSGDITVEYDDTMVENLFAALGLLLILGAVAGIVTKPRPIPDLLGPSQVSTLYGFFGYGSLAIVLIMVVALIVGGHIAAKVEWLSDEPPGATIKKVLHHGQPDNLKFTPARHCLKAYVRNPKFGCSQRDLDPRIEPAKLRRGKIPSCLSVGVPPQGKTTFTFDLPKGTTHLKGYAHHLKGGPAYVKINDAAPAPARGRGQPFNLQVSNAADKATFLISSKKGSRVCIEAVAIEQP